MCCPELAEGTVRLAEAVPSVVGAELSVVSLSQLNDTCWSSQKTNCVTVAVKVSPGDPRDGARSKVGADDGDCPVDVESLVLVGGLDVLSDGVSDTLAVVVAGLGVGDGDVVGSSACANPPVSAAIVTRLADPSAAAMARHG